MKKFSSSHKHILYGQWEKLHDSGVKKDIKGEEREREREREREIERRERERERAGREGRREGKRERERLSDLVRQRLGKDIVVGQL